MLQQPDLQPDDLDAWRHDGYLHLPGAFSAEQVAAIAAWVDDIAGPLKALKII